MPEEDCLGFRSPKPVVATAFRVGRKLAAIRRNIGPFKGKLAFPGGYVGQSEDWRWAALRTLREELGLDLSILGVTPRLCGPPFTGINHLALFATVDLPRRWTRRLESIPAYHDPEGVSEGRVSEVVLIDPSEREAVKLGVPAHQMFWERFDPKTLEYGLPPMASENIWTSAEDTKEH